MNRTKVALFFFLVAMPLLLAGCASTRPVSRSETGAPEKLSGKTDTSGDKTPDPNAAGTTGGTPLALPTRDQLNKNSFDSTVLGYLETGSPESLRQAVAAVNGDPRGMTDRNRICLAVAAEMMKILYPLEIVDWPIPSVPETDPYIGALRSARLGVYDYNTGNSDFLSLVLPSLVLVTGSATAGNYSGDAEDALRKAAAMNEKSVLPPRLLALLASSQGKQDLAATYNKKAWDLDSSCYPAGIDWSRALVREGKGEEALAVARSLSLRYPDSPEIKRLCAEAAFATGDWALADGYVLAVLKTEPNNASFLLMRVRILIERKEYLKANSLLDAFATTNRTNRDYLLLRSRVAREWNKNPVSASGILQEAQRLYPDDPEVLLASAEICYQTNTSINDLGGRDFVNRVLAKDGANPVALALLVKDYTGNRDWANAVKTGESLVAADSGVESRALLLRAYIGSLDLVRANALAKSLYSSPSPSDEVTSLYLETLIVSGDTKTASTVISSRMEGASTRLKSILYYYDSKVVSGSDARLSALRSSLLADPRNRDSLFAMYGWYMERKDYRMAQYYLKQVIALDPANGTYLDLQTSLDELLAR